MQAVFLREGNKRKVFALTMNKGIPIYQNELYSTLDDRTKHKIVSYIDFLSNSKFPVSNPTISKQLKGCHNLYELRPKPVRLFFFMLGNDAVIIHGYVKKKNETDRTEIERAKSLKARFIKGEDSDA